MFPLAGRFLIWLSAGRLILTIQNTLSFFITSLIHYTNIYFSSHSMKYLTDTNEIDINLMDINLMFGLLGTNIYVVS